MITFLDLVTEIRRQGAQAASLISLANSPTSKSVVGVLAQRTGLQVTATHAKENFDLYLVADVVGRLKSPFAVVCVAAEQVVDPQQLGVDVDHELRLLGIYDRPTLLLHSGPFDSVRPHFVFSDQHFVFLSPAEVVQILLAHPPRNEFAKRLIESTPIRLLNPYIYRGPIDDDRLFVGRKDDLDLLTKMNASYALVGPRSIGKTSLINKAVKKLKGQGRVVLRTEFSRAIGEHELLAKFIDQFVGEHEAWPGFVNRVSAASFEKLVEHYSSHERVIVFIDEADELTKLCPNLTASLHRLHNEGRLRFVLVGYKELRRSISDAAGVLFNTVQRLDLSSISLRECGALVVRPTAELGITFEDVESVVATIYAASGGAPSHSNPDILRIRPMRERVVVLL
ncbi:MAG: AAA family ATPase [Planctomycetaceae bacterium]